MSAGGGGALELAFVEAYYRGALRKPQVVADALLRAVVTSGQEDRLMLTAAIAEPLAEAARRLCAVQSALFDRRFPVGRTLREPLPGVEAWRHFAQWAGTTGPREMLRDLGIGDEALASAERLRSEPDIAWVSPLVAAAENGTLMVLPQDGGRGRTVLVGSPDGEPPAAIAVSEDDAASLADLTAEFTSIARGFLASYIRARRGAGRWEHE